MQAGCRDCPASRVIAGRRRSDLTARCVAGVQRGFTSKRTGAVFAITVPGVLLLNISSDAL